MVAADAAKNAADATKQKSKSPQSNKIGVFFFEEGICSLQGNVKKVCEGEKSLF